jgi:hypothetical protein
MTAIYRQTMKMTAIYRQTMRMTLSTDRTTANWKHATRMTADKKRQWPTSLCAVAYSGRWRGRRCCCCYCCCSSPSSPCCCRPNLLLLHPGYSHPSDTFSTSHVRRITYVCPPPHNVPGSQNVRCCSVWTYASGVRQQLMYIITPLSLYLEQYFKYYELRRNSY